MPTYITLIRLTQQGVEKVKDAPVRLDKAKAAIKAAGGEMKAYYSTLGQYDGVAISEAPSDETYAATLLALAAAGAIRTETLRAFSEADFRKIVAAIP